MAHWDAQAGRIVYMPSRPDPDHPGWEVIDCGCCAGIEWGGESPRECRRCAGGIVYHHVRTHRLALYPGGPFAGQLA
jgi:hypothetical protein